MSMGKDSKKSGPRDRLHDRLISLLLAAIWICAAIIVYKSNSGIPLSMLVVATIFFIMLVPAMKELVRVIDRRVKIQLGLSNPADE